MDLEQTMDTQLSLDDLLGEEISLEEVALAPGSELLVVPYDMLGDTVTPVPMLVMPIQTDMGVAQTILDAEQNGGIVVHKPVLIIPYIPVIAEKLKKIANEFQLDTWYTFPSKLTEQFNQYGGKLHLSKTQNSIYCIQCSCRIQYVGESRRNLKTRLAEHFHQTSNSAFSIHCRSVHGHHFRLPLHDIMVLAQEKHGQKCKILESLAIEYKSTHHCNSGLSTDLPAVWQLCAKGLSRKLAMSD